MILGLLLAAPLAAQSPALLQLQDGAQFPDREAPPTALAAAPAEPLQCVFEGVGGRRAAGEAAWTQALASRAVYAGEIHDRAAQHLAQRDLLDALSAARPGVAAGFEMLYTTQQAALDRYLSGATSAEEFQREVDWKKTWGFPFDLYRPIFELMRAKGLKGLALNAPASLVKKVALSGLESLTPAERAQIPADLKLSDDPAYLAMLTATFKNHGGDPGDPVALRHYLDAMMLWNETMADGVAGYLKSNPQAQVLVIAGAFHAYDSGIPYGVSRRLGGLPQTTVVLGEAEACPVALGVDELNLKADFHWIIVK